MKKSVVVIGASPKPERYSNMACRLLLKEGHVVLPVNPAFELIEGIPTKRRVEDITEDVDTVTMYVNADRSAQLAEAILALNPRRVIFNPGSESRDLAQVLSSRGVEVLEACTLVMLRTGQF